MNEFIENIPSGNGGESTLVILAVGIIFFAIVLSMILIISYVKALKKAEVSVANILWIFLPLLGTIILALKLDPVKKFEKGTGYLIGLILLPIIFVPLLAFSDKKNNVSNEANTNNSFDAKSLINGEPNTNTNTFEQNIPLASNIDTVNTNEINTPKQDDVLNENELNQEPVAVANNIPTEPSVEEISVETVSEIPTIEPQEAALIVEEQKNNTINAFNSVPEINLEPQPLDNTNIETDSFNDSVNNTPINNEPSKTEIPVINNNQVLGEQKKVCKNCGTELPNIVSICPNCGTDNE